MARVICQVFAKSGYKGISEIDLNPYILDNHLGHNHIDHIHERQSHTCQRHYRAGARRRNVAGRHLLDPPPRSTFSGRKVFMDATHSEMVMTPNKCWGDPIKLECTVVRIELRYTTLQNETKIFRFAFSSC